MKGKTAKNSLSKGLHPVHRRDVVNNDLTSRRQSPRSAGNSYSQELDGILKKNISSLNCMGPSCVKPSKQHEKNNHFNHISSKGLDPSHQKDQQSPDARRVNLLLTERLLQQPQDQLHPGTADPIRERLDLG